MPEPGWKTIAVRDDLYFLVQTLAGELDRPINWVATRAIEYVTNECLPPSPGSAPPWEFDKGAAERFGLR